MSDAAAGTAASAGASSGTAPSATAPLTVALRERVQALHHAVTLGADRLPPAELAAAHEALARAGQRSALTFTPTVVALAGGTGSGKSSLFNAVVQLPLSPVGLRRPTTHEVVACVWTGSLGSLGSDATGVPADLLDWLGVPARNRLLRASELDDGSDPELAGLVLLDLPDHDSVRAEDRGVVDALVTRADLLVWVVDPQKYADAALHDRYLARLEHHSGVVAVVLNQCDRLDDAARAVVAADLQRLLAEHGLGGCPLLLTSASAGTGLEQLHRLVGSGVRARRAGLDRLTADVVAAAVRLDAALGRVAAPTDAGVGRLVDALSVAVALPTIVEQLGGGRDDGGTVVASLPHVADAVAAYVTAVGGDLPPAWRTLLSRCVEPRAVADALTDALRSVDVTRAGPSSLRRLFMSTARMNELRRTALRTRLYAAVAGVATSRVVLLLGDELARHAEIRAGLGTAADRPAP